MRHFYGGALPLHRQLEELLRPGLPRALIPARGQEVGLTACPSSCLLALLQAQPWQPGRADS